ncbi:hypothetical protein D322_1578 [Yersinia enterocolitica IP 10393]|nr:hypothetical protein DJ62_3872 [Yersinia enterocolitica]CCO68452.1 hypothetical protein D322_1578 [Yersinia enterocolitica IP 10393]
MTDNSASLGRNNKEPLAGSHCDSLWQAEAGMHVLPAIFQLTPSGEYMPIGISGDNN